MLQLPFWTMLNVTGRPELAVALTVKVDPTVCAGMALKVIVCDLRAAAATVKLCETDVAAAYVLFPACEAVMVHVPAVSNVAVLPDTVQTLLVEEA